MKKFYLALALGLICVVFSSCDSRSKEQRLVEKSVLDELQRSFGDYVNSIRVIETEITPKDERVFYDTVYHVARIYAEDGRYEAYKFDVDSIGILQTTYAAYNQYRVVCELSNKNGAVQDVRYRYMCNCEEYSSDDFASYEIMNPTEFRRRYFLHYTGIAVDYVKEGLWYKDISLKIGNRNAHSEILD